MFDMSTGKSRTSSSIRVIAAYRYTRWKWDRITMDFVTGLPLSLRKKDAIWVIVDKLTKSTYFLPIKMDYTLEKYAELYINEILRLHGVPISIILDRDPRFTSRFWKKLQEALRTRLNFNTAFHHQTDGQSERVIQVLEDMLRSSELVRQTEEKVKIIKERLKDAIDRQKSYVDLRRKDVEFVVGDKVFLKVSPWKKVLRFGKKAETIDVQSYLTYEKEPMKILAKEMKELRNKKIPLVKLLWRNHKVEEATWESEEVMKQQYP
ncbi:uncharacterized protein LOC110624208 [Manihot esculenta]|uniref:uncharacterized protein LOC110624208 n=1 Tax=Manihot esculenta TaxID=3983 RepID=UPI000B5D47E7|nr:uncharacterized protein LOC110624208 [Manihot esculenta]